MDSETRINAAFQNVKMGLSHFSASNATAPISVINVLIQISPLSFLLFCQGRNRLRARIFGCHREKFDVFRVCEVDFSAIAGVAQECKKKPVRFDYNITHNNLR